MEAEAAIVKRVSAEFAEYLYETFGKDQAMCMSVIAFTILQYNAKIELELEQ